MNTTPSTGPRTRRTAATSARSTMDTAKLLTVRQIYDADFAGQYGYNSFQVRLANLRNGWTQRRRKTAANPYHREGETEYPPELVEGRDWIKVGHAVLYTPAGHRRIVKLLKRDT